jgi:hypothetical protein
MNFFQKKFNIINNFNFFGQIIFYNYTWILKVL